MTDILCSWLNGEVKLSTKVDAANFARHFSNGYLIGEVLEKYTLQDDFDQFSQNTSANSKLNNFTRLEPMLHLLEVPFDTNIARDIMTEKYGVATRLMYQLFIALNKKEKSNLTGVAIETMRPAAPVKLEGVERIIYKERLKNMTPRQTDLNLDALVARFHEKQITLEATAFKERFEEEERHMQDLMDRRDHLMKRHKDSAATKADMLAKINPDDDSSSTGTLSPVGKPSKERAATVHIPKPPASRSAKAINQRNQMRTMAEAYEAQEDIQTFEERMKRTLPPSKPIGESPSSDDMEARAMPDNIDLIRPSSNGEYINKIRTRLNEDASARAEREKRRRKVLVDQLKAHEAQEEARREEMLVNRLMRQSQQERRIAVQLLHARHEKEIIRKNRLTREQQYEERRLREFEEALNSEAEMARLAKLEYIEQTKRDQELHDKIAAQRAEERYQKHYNMCTEELLSMVDFSTKVGEYRQLTNKLLPEKLMREWTSLFVAGKPLYEEPVNRSDSDPSAEGQLEEERQKLLDEGDFNEYRNMVGDWQPPEESGIAGPPRNNPIVGHIVQRLADIVRPPSPPVEAPVFPDFPIKACILGKVFAGKSQCVKRLAENHRLVALSADGLLQDALEAAKNQETPGEHEFLDSRLSSRVPSQMSETSPTPRTAEESIKEDGAEKTDPEKPVPSEEIAATPGPEPMVKTASSNARARSNSVCKTKRGVSSTRNSSRQRLSNRAKLGAKAAKSLKKGRPVEDILNVEIIIDAVRRIPEGTGWILDGFPSSYNQAKLLEKALSGLDPEGREKAKNQSKKSVLAPDPRPEQPTPDPPSGINAVLLLDINNELCLRRSAGRTAGQISGQAYQQEFNPPPEGAATGICGQEQVTPVTDAAHDQEQIQHKLTAFQDSWPKLEKWFMKFGSLHSIDASLNIDSVYYEVEKIMEDTVNKLQGKNVEESAEPLETEAKLDEVPPEPEVKPVETPLEPPKDLEVDRSRPGSKKGSRAGSKGDKSPAKSPSRSGSKAGKSGKGSAKEGKDSRGGTGKGSRAGKKGKTPEPEPEPEPEEPPGTPPPQPGSDEWEYVDQPLEQELATILSPQWDLVEKTYINNSKQMFRKTRDEREGIIRYFYQIRKDYLAYLRRPDHKQEFVSQWQKAYNELPDDLRDDEEMRSELHQQLDDLRERLWSICDERKEQAENERTDVMNATWLDDRLGLVSNHYITIMQGEVDRFQDSVRLLKDYYKGMEGKIPDAITEEYARVPLIELPVEDRPGSAKSVTSETEVPPPGSATQEKPRSRPVTPKSSPSKSTTPSGKRKKGKEEGAATPAAETIQEVDGKKTRIPLVPRRPVTPDPNAAAAKGAKDAKAKGKDAKGKETTGETPPPPADPDARLIFDGHQTGVSAIERMIEDELAAELAAREAEEEAERAREVEREKERLVAAAAAGKKGGKGGGGKKGKSRSPSPKKGKEKDAPSQGTPPPMEEESEEEKSKKMAKEKAKVEFFSAIEEEANAARTRLELIKSIGTSGLNTLKNSAEETFLEMNDWLGARFLKEMESIDHMAEVMRNGIEESKRLKEELIIAQEDFLINENIKVLKTPTPPPRPPPIEAAHLDTFTIDQIVNVYGQFSLTAPSGVLSVKSFQETFQDLASLTHGSENLPEMWSNLLQDPEKLEMMCNQLSPDGEFIDWRVFLLAASQPWPQPTQTDLLDTLERFKVMDQQSTGCVTREQYEQVELWFQPVSKPISPENPSDPYSYDRLGNLQHGFFEMFANHNVEPSQLDYVTFLLYFSAAQDSYEGFLRALSVASGVHMPRLRAKDSQTAEKTVSRPVSAVSLGEVSVELQAAGGDVTVPPQEDVPDAAMNAKVPLDALDKVLHHGQSQAGDSHRFSVTADPEDACSRERLAGVYQEFGSDESAPVLFSSLIEHPIIQDITSTFHTFKSIDLGSILTHAAADAMDSHSVKTSE